MKKIVEEFQNPDETYRIKPFWFWNGEMTKEEIRHQIQEMAEKGLGGMFICARQGMTIPYLSKEWFEMTAYACDTAKEFGLEAWLYDEYPYPSGMSGGEVLLEHPEAEHMILHHKRFYVEGNTEVEEDLGWSRILYAKAIPVNTIHSENGINTGNTVNSENIINIENTISPENTENLEESDWADAIDLKDCVGNLQTEKIYQRTGLTKYNDKRFFSYGPRKILKTCLPEGTWRIEIYAESAMGDFKYYGGFFDPCNADAVQTFLETTHERYKKAVGEQFGTSVRGMFSDEVGLLSPIPWSKRIPEEFLRRKGYDIVSCLPALHDNKVKDAYKIRYDLYDVAHQVFRDTYHKMTAEWCQNHRLLYATEVPSMRLGTQKYSDIIGGDSAHEKLGQSLEWIYDEYIRNYRSNAKAVSSLARQLKKPYAMIESFHSLGWSMTLQDAKWMIDRLGSSGITLYNFHAFYYTIQDITKHDAPPSQFLQNPYWKHYRLLADYVGRMGTIVGNTTADISIAVLDPTSALWSLLGNPFHGFSYQGESAEEKAVCDRTRDDWVHICKILLFSQMDYDHLDAEMLANAVIEDGTIRLGNASYSVVILPPCHCMEESARRALEQFVRQGGCLIGLGELPSCKMDENEIPKESWEALFEQEHAHFFACEGSIREAGAEFEKNWLSLCRRNARTSVVSKVKKGNPKDVIVSVRTDEEQNIYVFVVNQGKEHVTITLNLNENENESKHKNEYKSENTQGKYLTAEWWNLEDGNIQTLREQWDGQAMDISLTAYESKWICLKSKMTQNEEQDRQTEQMELVGQTEKIVTVPFTGKKQVKIDGNNILRLGMADMSLDKVQWARVESGTFIEQCKETSCLREKHLTYTGSFGTPQKLHPKYPISCWYRMRFEVETIPEQVSLLMDRESIAGKFQIQINGRNLEPSLWNSVFVNDQNNQAADIKSLLQLGINEILVSCKIEQDEDGFRDPIYLWGTFGVKLGNGQIAGCLTVMPDEAELRHTWIEGFPHYSGTFCFTENHTVLLDTPENETGDTIKNAMSVQELPDTFLLRLELTHPIYDCVEVLVNGNSLGVKAFTPYLYECRKEWLQEGDNTTEVRVTNTLVNMLDGRYFDYDAHKLIEIIESSITHHLGSNEP